ncbi:hypothetical protein HNR60_003597 [Rhodopseudomonas rhenobacensis]|uniref:Uncharacterized protein n=1 Tax=Rhodopseudomonas rhenobacensis TaxID=87461 RepID=A0A7W8E0E8_9BRAD|nr:hypothetical protein [Rhodopseudomonas rhenobacensis]MBB5048827.1 hypothetical protein [Rhodopseudomonas rhenobacensis]
MTTPRKSKKPKPAHKPPPKTREQRDAEKQALAMWALLGAGGAGYGGKLKPKIEKAEREALRQAGLIEVAKGERQAYLLTVTDKGWDWAERHLADPLPESGVAFVLQAWLKRLAAYLKARDLRLADVLGTPAVPDPAESAAPDGKPAPAEPTDLRQRIRDAYLAVAGGFNRRALLKDLRAKLPEIERSALDAALKQMQREQQASLMQLDNRIDVTDADREAAIQIGNEPRHIVWIEN